MTINRHVSALFRMGDAWLNQKIKGCGISGSSAYMLLELSTGDEISLKELSKRGGVDQAHTTRMVRILERAGLVGRAPARGDARSCIITITEKGRNVATITEQAILEWVAIITDGISPADIETTNSTLTRFYENALAGLFVSRSV
jgi:DNA-binding MarR family transcriptional regulator